MYLLHDYAFFPAFIITYAFSFLYFRHNIIRAGAGRSHTLVVTKDGISLSFGCNKHGQLGSGSLKNGGFFPHVWFSGNHITSNVW